MRYILQVYLFDSGWTQVGPSTNSILEIAARAALILKANDNNVRDYLRVETIPF